MSRGRLHAAGAAVALLSIAGAAGSADPATSSLEGETPKAWRQLGGSAQYTTVDGTIVGTSVPDKANSFSVTKQEFGDFILDLDVRQDIGPTNSGIQFRSLSTAQFHEGRVHGYQVDIDPSERAWSGGIYEEAERGWLYPVDLNPPAKSLYRFGEWNHMRLEALGRRIRVWINEQPVSDLIDDGHDSGFIGLQVHGIEKPEDAGRTTKFRNLRVRTQKLEPAPPMGIFIRNTLANDLDPDEARQGWRLLWDGRSAKGWRSAAGDRFPDKGWSMADGALSVQPGGGGGDIMTEEQFGAFELQMEFKTTAGANSGIFYFLTAAHDPASGAPLGLEYQILDDERHPDAKAGIDGNRTIASLYDILPRAPLAGNVGIGPKIDAWQHARIVARADGSVEHWLNGVKVLQFNRHSDDYRAHVAASKFKSTPAFGEAARGHILLQDHGDAVRFRSIKIRPLE